MEAIRIGRANPGPAFVYVSWESSVTPQSTEQLFKDNTVRGLGVATSRKLQMTLQPNLSQNNQRFLDLFSSFISIIGILLTSVR